MAGVNDEERSRERLGMRVDRRRTEQKENAKNCRGSHFRPFRSRTAPSLRANPGAVRRRFFLSSLAATLAGPNLYPLAASASARKIDRVGIADILATIPGTVAVYARLMDGRPPEIAIRPDLVVASASVIKLVKIHAVYSGYERRAFHPQTPVVVHGDDIVGGSDDFSYTLPGTAIPIQRLVNGMIHVSDNTASNALISFLGFDHIARTIHHAGLRHTRLARHFADVVPAGSINLNVTSAGDMGHLLYAIERGAREGVPTVATPESCRGMINVMLGQEDTSKIPAGLPKHVAIAHKTGEVTGVRHDVAIVSPFGDLPFVLAILTTGDDDYAAVDAGIGRIAARVYTIFHRRAVAAQPGAAAGATLDDVDTMQLPN